MDNHSSKYELMKMARTLKKEDKILFLDSIDELVVLAKSPRKEVLRNMELDAIEEVNSFGMVDESKPRGVKKTRQSRPMDTKSNPDDKKYVPKNYSHLNTGNDSGSFGHEFMGGKENDDMVKVSKRLHDPETREEMEDVISLMEKNLNIDGDFSFDTISLFLIPLLHGAQRMSMKKYRVVGLVKMMVRICRRFQRTKEFKKSQKEKFEVRREFNKCLNMIKERLEIPKKKVMASIASLSPDTVDISKDDILRNNVFNLKTMGLGPEDAKKQVLAISSGLTYDAIQILDSVISEVYSS